MAFGQDNQIDRCDFNLPDISWSPPTDSFVAMPLSAHDLVNGLLDLSLQQTRLKSRLGTTWMSSLNARSYLTLLENLSNIFTFCL
ncbi:uncharacterized protein LOC127012038 isoform X2 [Drosophila biarmipes]|uniref:uncharacterized protein LOC127012038 isoform X2 n=1 Tax=Drosophila biarmipes TaxID=125945 RepID=UPI0021CC61A1|nr:uncharacterized protein LOC127012038 isoform X2 [Drosophila biarmipes]